MLQAHPQLSSERFCGGIIAVLACVALGGGCQSTATDAPDAMTADAATRDDASRLDAGELLSTDAGVAPLDAFAPDAGAAGFAHIAGPCGRLAGELHTMAPSYFTSRLDFMMDGYDDPAERPLLTEGAQAILEAGTAGGSSGISEAFAFEFLARCEGATFVKSETEVVYDPVTSKKTDILVSIAGDRVGVSVTRAESFPRDAPYTTSNAAFIERKLNDILESTRNVVAEDRWVKQVLFVYAYGDMHAEAVRTVWDGLSMATRADTVLYIVVTDGDDAAIY